MDFFKKAISPVVATALLLVVAVVSVVGFSGWFQTFQSELFVDIERQGSISNLNIGVEALVGEILYFRSADGTQINSVTIAGVECSGLNSTYSSGIQALNVSNCLDQVTSTTPEIVIVTNSAVLSKRVFIVNNNQVNLEGSCNTQVPTVIENNGNFNLLSNGIVTCVGASVGDTGVLNGVIYTAVSNQNLSDRGVLESDVPFYETACTSLVTTMNFQDSITGGVFYNSNINPDISHWDVSNVTNMRGLFQTASNFNQDLSNWDVSNVTNMQNLFSLASNLNVDISCWDVSQVTSCINFNYSSTSSNIIRPEFENCDPDMSAI